VTCTGAGADGTAALAILLMLSYLGCSRACLLSMGILLDRECACWGLSMGAASHSAPWALDRQSSARDWHCHWSQPGLRVCVGHNVYPALRSMANTGTLYAIWVLSLLASNAEDGHGHGLGQGSTDCCCFVISLMTLSVRRACCSTLCCDVVHYSSYWTSSTCMCIRAGTAALELLGQSCPVSDQHRASG
jgi:hypothetical protein